MTVRARVFGKERTLVLTGVRGYHAIAQTADEGPAGLHLVTAANMLPCSHETFARFMRDCRA